MTIPPISPESRAEALADELMGTPLTVPSQERKAWFARRVAQAIREAEEAVRRGIRRDLSPRFWSAEMDRAWHTKIPDVQAAFDAILDIALRHKETP